MDTPHPPDLPPQVARRLAARLRSAASEPMPDDVQDKVTAALAVEATVGGELRGLDDLAVRRLRTLLDADDTGPMPPDVAERVLSALAAEGAPAPWAAAEPVAAHPPPADPRGVSPLRPGRPARRRWVLGLGAAAAVAAVGLVGTAVVRGLPGPTTPGDGAAVIRVDTSAHRYDAAGLPEQARRLLERPATSGGGSGGASGGSSGDTDAGPLATPRGLASCLRGLGLQGATSVAVDLATYDDAPAAVVVATTDGRSTAWVVRRSCAASAPGVVRGGVPVP